MDILGKLFGSAARVAIMRLVLANTPGLPLAEIEKKSRINKKTTKRELKMLATIGFLKLKKKTVLPNFDFAYFEPLREMLVAFPERQELTKKLSRFGKLKLVVISGSLLDEPSPGADLLVVGDRLKKRALEQAIGQFEAGLGRSITFAIMDTPEFIYRYGMYDKFVRNMLDFEHEKLICAAELSTKLGWV